MVILHLALEQEGGSKIALRDSESASFDSPGSDNCLGASGRPLGPCYTLSGASWAILGDRGAEHLNQM